MMHGCCGCPSRPAAYDPPDSRPRRSLSMQITALPGSGYRLQTEFWAPQSIDQVFGFFSDAFNLQELTPPFLNFRVLTPAPIAMQVGTVIDYQIQLHRIPIRWKTLISAWEPQSRFVDEQVRGPYRHWHHEHTFEVRNGGTLIRDVVHYGVPGTGIPGGSLIHNWLVKPDLQTIFQYRTARMQARFGGHDVELGDVTPRG